MKKIFIPLALVALCGCEKDDGKYDFDHPNELLLEWNHVIEVTAKGETHEYLKFDRGISHLPNCKYCNKKDGDE